MSKNGTASSRFASFELMKKAYELDLQNRRHIADELGREEAWARKLARKGLLSPANGLAVFAETCRRRIAARSPLGGYKHRSLMRHSAQVGGVARCIAAASGDHAFAEAVGTAAFCHDVGYTMILPALVRGKTEPIPARELLLLRMSHLQAGTHLLELYRDFMLLEEYRIARLSIEGHHIAYDGKGTRRAPSYPDRVGEGGKYLVAEEIIKSPRTRRVMRNQLPEVMGILRVADIFSAVLMKRLEVGRHEDTLGKLTGVEKLDTALAVLVTVSGTDVDPEVVRKLMLHGFGVPALTAELVLSALPCEDTAQLRERTIDMRHADEVVMADPRFRGAIPARSTALSRLLDDTSVVFRELRKPLDLADPED